MKRVQVVQMFNNNVSWAPPGCLVLGTYFYYFYHQEKHLLAHSNCYPHFTCFAVCKEAA